MSYIKLLMKLTKKGKVLARYRVRRCAIIIYHCMKPDKAGLGTG